MGWVGLTSRYGGMCVVYVCVFDRHAHHAFTSRHTLFPSTSTHPLIPTHTHTHSSAPTSPNSPPIPSPPRKPSPSPAWPKRASSSPTLCGARWATGSGVSVFGRDVSFLRGRKCVGSNPSFPTHSHNNPTPTQQHNNRPPEAPAMEPRRRHPRLRAAPLPFSLSAARTAAL